MASTQTTGWKETQEKEKEKEKWSSKDLGVGEFLDLKLHVDWAVNSGFHLVQLLPINDTSVHGMIFIQNIVLIRDRVDNAKPKKLKCEHVISRRF
uniref:4-alpha-glucanotransferase n=1 Tax=Oryza brachyantha TaxID=4533 RepID=J3KZX2_ORYBR